MRRVAQKSVLRLQSREVRSRSAEAFPAWVDNEDAVAPLTAGLVTPRVRDGLVLRMVAKGRGAKKRRAGNARGR